MQTWLSTRFSSWSASSFSLELVGLELLLGEDVGAADLDGALGDLREALAGAAGGDGDGDVDVGVHEGIGSLLDERLEGGGAGAGDGAGERDVGGALVTLGGGLLGGGATAGSEAGDGGNATGDANKLTTREIKLGHEQSFPVDVAGTPQGSDRFSENPRRRPALLGPRFRCITGA